MKKIVCLSLLFASLLTACGVGSYSVAGGTEDAAYVCIVAEDEFDVAVTVDGTTYNTRTVKQKAFKKRRDIKNTTREHIKVGVGTHDLKVEADGKVLLNKKIVVATGETKVIEL